jgi:hypothetical protein
MREIRMYIKMKTLKAIETIQVKKYNQMNVIAQKGSIAIVTRSKRSE